jgi:hypothetical protein
MNYEILISAIVLAGSIFGILSVVFRKIPILTELPEVREGYLKEPVWTKIENRIKNSKHVKSFSFELFLQKLLSKIRVLTLKIESKTASQLQTLRQRAQRKNLLGEDNYWEKLKKTARRRKK